MRNATKGGSKSRTRDALRRTAPLATLVLVGCVATSSPRVRACTPPAAGGALTILPSEVSGVRIDSAFWSTGAGAQELGTYEALSYYARLRAARRVERSELAIIYDERGSHPVLDLDIESWRQGRELAVQQPPLTPGDTTTVTRSVVRNGSFRTGKWSVFDYCPRSARLVARNELAFALMPRLTSDSVRSAASDGVRRSGSPLVVVKDTLVSGRQYGADASSYVGAAINTADTALADMMVALVVLKPVDPTAGSATRMGTLIEDTLEYHVGPVPARGRVGVVGNAPRYREGIAERISYPAARVTGRRVAPPGGRIRVSEVRREQAEEAEAAQRRASQPFSTDAEWYTARRGPQIRPGAFAYDITIVTRWTNITASELYLMGCRSGSPTPWFSLARSGSRSPSPYTPSPPCTGGATAIRVEPGAVRVDTLRARGLASPEISMDRAGMPMPGGAFEVVFDVRGCLDDPRCALPMYSLTHSPLIRVRGER